MAAKSKHVWQDNPAAARPLNGMHPYPEFAGAPLNGNGNHQYEEHCMDPSVAHPSNATIEAEQGQLHQVDASREPDGQAPACESPEEQRRREDDILARANVIRSLRGTLAFVDKGPWPEPQRRADQWSYLLKEAKWLAVDVAQERRWKLAVAKAVAHEAAKLDRSRLRFAPGVYADEVRCAMQPPAASQAELPRRGGKRSLREPSEGARQKGSSASLHSRSPSVNDAAALDQEQGSTSTNFTYKDRKAMADIQQACIKAAERAAIAKDMAVWKYNCIFEKSLLEAREQALAARKALTAEIRGRDRTPLLDLDENFGRQPKRRKIRSSYDEVSVEPEPELSLPNKRLSAYRKQVSRPGSRISDDARRDLEIGVETSGRRDRESRRKRKKMEYEDDDYEEPPRIREPKLRKTAIERARPSSRNDPRSLRSSKKNSMLGGRQGVRHLDPESVLNWNSHDDQMLCCIVHEFGSNWLLVSDILSSSMRMSGIRRSALQCKARFFELAESHFEEGQERDTQAALEGMRISKIGARDVIAKSIPVPDVLLGLHQKILHTLCMSQREKKARNREVEKSNCLHMTEPHPSVTTFFEVAFRQSGNRRMNPMQIAESSDHLAQQQAVAQQQAAQVAAAAPPVAPGMSGGPAVAQSPPGNRPHAPDIPQLGSPSAHLMQQPGNAMSHQGHPNLGRGLAVPGKQQQDFSNVQAQAMPPPAAPAQNRQINLAQLQDILRSGKMPNGQDLTAMQRQNLMNRINLVRSRQPGMLQGMAGRPVGGPGLPFNQATSMRPMPGMQAVPGNQLGMGSPMANAGGLAMPNLQQSQPQMASSSRGIHHQAHMAGINHANAMAPQMQAQGSGNPSQLQGMNGPGVGSPQQIGGIPSALPGHLPASMHSQTGAPMANHLQGRGAGFLPTAMHSQTGAPMANHLQGRGAGFPAGYGGQVQAGGGSVGGVMSRPGSQRPPLPGPHS